MNTGLIIKRLREEKKLSVIELAERLNVSRGVIYGYETGDRIPPTSKLKRLAEIFEVSVSELLEQKQESVQNNRTIPEDVLLEKLERLEKQNAQLIENNTVLIQLLRDSGVQLGKLNDLKVTVGELHPGRHSIRAFQVAAS